MHGFRDRLMLILVLLAVALAAISTACGGGTPPVEDPAAALPPTITAVMLAEPHAPGQVSEASLAWAGGTPPFAVEMRMGGGASQDMTPREALQRSYSHAFTLLNPAYSAATYAYTVTVTDSLQRSDTHSGEYTVGPTLNPQLTVSVPAAMGGGLPAEWELSWQGGQAPFTLELDFGGGVEGGLQSGQAQHSPYTRSFTMRNPSDTAVVNLSYSFHVRDAFGALAQAAGSYSIGPRENLTPVVDSALYNAAERLLHVQVSDPDSDLPLTVTITEPQALHADALSKQADGAVELSATFAFSAVDPLAGGSGNVRIDVIDAHGAVSAGTLVNVAIPAFQASADALYAISWETDLDVGEEVLVVVSTGPLSHAFQFLNGVGLTIERDAEKVADSFNVGAPGGAPETPDGVWGPMQPSGGLFLPPDGMIVAKDVGGGRERWDFNLIPIEGKDMLFVAGPLFNIRFRFTAPGVKHFAFQEVSGVKRSYYSDSLQQEYTWENLTNSAAPTLTVH